MAKSKEKKEDDLTTTVHLADGVLHNAKHTNAHAQRVKDNKDKSSKDFNAKHAAKHAEETLIHAKKLKEHLLKSKKLKQLEKKLDGKEF